MLFHEIYGCYYQAVSKALAEAVRGTLTARRLREIIDETAFSESFLAIVPALTEQRWQLLDGDFRAQTAHAPLAHTPLAHTPTRPPTTLERRWLKAVSLDPRFRLFGLEPEGLADVEPLFTHEDYVVFDRYGDGDPYEDEAYIAHFRTILAAIRNGDCLRIRCRTGRETLRSVTDYPKALEYSEKDDKFRLVLRGRDYGSINLQRIEQCEIAEEHPQMTAPVREQRRGRVVFELTDERNALERAMLHFSHFEKQAEKLGDGRYRATVYYASEDETELVIRVLSFGPMLRVVEPESFVEQIRRRLIAQRNLGI